MARRKLEMTVQEQLRQAIQESELSIYALAKLTGISHQQISRFAKGERGLTLGSFTALAAALGLRLAPEADTTPVAVAPVAIQDDEVLAAIRANRKARTPARLADVFRDLQAGNQALTLGAFHDAVRRLRTAGRIETEPFTGAMYQLTDPETCLLIGREIMAYVVLR